MGTFELEGRAVVGVVAAAVEVKSCDRGGSSGADDDARENRDKASGSVCIDDAPRGDAGRANRGRCGGSAAEEEPGFDMDGRGADGSAFSSSESSTSEAFGRKALDRNHMVENTSTVKHYSLFDNGGRITGERRVLASKNTEFGSSNRIKNWCLTGLLHKIGGSNEERSGTGWGLIGNG
ncbi:hypothetical protein B0H17DRAFT_1124040 [Mycena rosella]|uniref:Uncharacterized protein n=1 Tax=Mycena rosella TaxID=1033263 RepID=A0AAD7H332_MYCRO|nr:hypothetical protein B0H17DRAFT_1124040 [Mycena rosella]